MPDEETTPTLPAAQPTTVEMVKQQLAIDDTDDDAAIGRVVAAVCAVVRGLPISSQALGLNTWPDDITHGATLMGAALSPHRKKPNGSPKVAVDEAAYQLLLEMGDYARPAAH